MAGIFNDGVPGMSSACREITGMQSCWSLYDDCGQLSNLITDDMCEMPAAFLLSVRRPFGRRGSVQTFFDAWTPMLLQAV